MEVIRSFVAIELPDELRSMLTGLQSQMKSHTQSPVKWVDPSGVHLTLKFLGNVAGNRIAEITQTIEAASSGVPPFQLEVKGLGVFPSLKRVQIIWVGLEGDIAQLCQLQQRIESSLAPLGFPPEGRPFTPHLTLARVRERATPEERQSLGQFVASARFETVYRFGVDSVYLMRSQLTREGAIYSQIWAVKLNRPTQISGNV